MDSMRNRNFHFDASFLWIQNKVSICRKFNPYFVCTCFQWYPLQIDAHIEPGIYAPNAVIDVGINVTNKSFRRVRNFRVQLVKVCNFHIWCQNRWFLLKNPIFIILLFKEVIYYSIDRSQKMKTMTVLNEMELRGCSSNQKYPICLGCQLKIPQTSLTDSTSMIINVRYFIQVGYTLVQSFQAIDHCQVSWFVFFSF